MGPLIQIEQLEELLIVFSVGGRCGFRSGRSFNRFSSEHAARLLLAAAEEPVGFKRGDAGNEEPNQAEERDVLSRDSQAYDDSEEGKMGDESRAEGH